MKYGTLNQTNPRYDAKTWRTIDDLYKGGFALIDKAHLYIPQGIGESTIRYQERLNQASYVNYLSTIVTSYVAGLFQRDVSVLPSSEDGELIELADQPFWDAFGKNIDLRGNPASHLLREVFQMALLKKRAFAQWDFPPSNIATSRAEEDASGSSRAYAFEVCPESLLDWEYSDIVTKRVGNVTFEVGRFEWAIVKRTIANRPSPEATRGLIVEEFKVWRMANGVATWELYRTAPRHIGEQPNPNEDLPLVGQGTTTFTRIPIVELHLPISLWLGNILGTLALEHFRRRSALVAAQDKSLFAIPVVYLGPEVGGFKQPQPSEAQANPNRGRTLKQQLSEQGFTVLGKDDRIEYVEPDGKGHDMVERQLDSLSDAMFRVTSQMALSVTATTSGKARSGLSKSEDRRSMEVVLSAYAAIVSDFAKRLYSEIASARGEEITWGVHGLESYETEDRTVLIDEAMKLVDIDIPSKTFKASYKTQLALSLVSVPPSVQDQIRTEIAQAPEEKPPVMDTNPLDDLPLKQANGVPDARNILAQ